MNLYNIEVLEDLANEYVEDFKKCKYKCNECHENEELCELKKTIVQTFHGRDNV